MYNMDIKEIESTNMGTSYEEYQTALLDRIQQEIGKIEYKEFNNDILHKILLTPPSKEEYERSKEYGKAPWCMLNSFCTTTIGTDRVDELGFSMYNMDATELRFVIDLFIKLGGDITTSIGIMTLLDMMLVRKAATMDDRKEIVQQTIHDILAE